MCRIECGSNRRAACWLIHCWKGSCSRVLPGSSTSPSPTPTPPSSSAPPPCTSNRPPNLSPVLSAPAADAAAMARLARSLPRLRRLRLLVAWSLWRVREAAWKRPGEDARVEGAEGCRGLKGGVREGGRGMGGVGAPKVGVCVGRDSDKWLAGWLLLGLRMVRLRLSPSAQGF